jgi:hypothetical protein
LIQKHVHRKQHPDTAKEGGRRTTTIPEPAEVPTAQRKAQLKRRFDRVFDRSTRLTPLDRLLRRLHARKSELLTVLDRREVPLHTNGSERDIRC